MFGSVSLAVVVAVTAVARKQNSHSSYDFTSTTMTSCHGCVVAIDVMIVEMLVTAAMKVKPYLSQQLQDQLQACQN